MSVQPRPRLARQETDVTETENDHTAQRTTLHAAMERQNEQVEAYIAATLAQVEAALRAAPGLQARH
jgi:hypothetical protein